MKKIRKTKNAKLSSSEVALKRSGQKSVKAVLTAKIKQLFSACLHDINVVGSMCGPNPILNQLAVLCGMSTIQYSAQSTRSYIICC